MRLLSSHRIPNAGRKPLSIALWATLLALTGCQAEAADPTTSPTTVTTAETTTSTVVRQSTTPPATLASTTPSTITDPAPTTTPGSTGPGIAEAQLGQRALQRTSDLERCYEAPKRCDIESYLNEYYVPGTTARERIRARYDEFISNDWQWTNVDAIENTLATVSISPDGDLATTQVCSRNGAIRVNASTGEVVSDGVGYFLYEFLWKRDRADTWKIIDADSSQAIPESDPACDF